MSPWLPVGHSIPEGLAAQMDNSTCGPGVASQGCCERLGSVVSDALWPSAAVTGTTAGTAADRQGYLECASGESHTRLCLAGCGRDVLSPDSNSVEGPTKEKLS